MRNAQLARISRKEEKADIFFIAKETYDILRLSFSGFDGYVKYLIDLAAKGPHHRLPRCRNGAVVSRNFAVSPAHSTTSFIEAWFSLMRALDFDDATKYMTGVLNQMMSKGITRSLQNNSWYE